ncbi:MAG: glycosyl hydrolase family 18 protein [Candidatus Choladocola sp.]|nr:glycosyl hydrolase family 18 protein [Candidatus Choladocola sp.]
MNHNKDHIKKKQFQILAGVIAGLGLLSILVVCILKFVPTSKRMSPEEYFGIGDEQKEYWMTEGAEQESEGNPEGETVPGGRALVILEDHIAQERALIFDGSAYIDYTLVQRELNSRFHWDASVGLMLFTTAEQVFEIAPNSTSYTVDGETFDAGYEILKTTSGGMFLSVNFMQQYSDLKCEMYESPSRIVVSFGSTSVTTAVLGRNTSVRYQGGIKSPVICDVPAGTEVTVLDQMENWSQIRTPDGYIGYVKNSRLKNVEETVRETYYQGPEYTTITMEDRVNLVWHQIDYKEMNAQFAQDTENMTGVNVISPTWYFLSDSTGEILSFADAAYVEEAHEAGLQVWPLISNFSENVSTTQLLASREARQKVQNYLVNQALELGFDGINIDFEGIAQEAGYDYVQFMRELSILCRKNGIVLSVDVPVPMDFSKHYNRRELGTVCDYVIVMGYDEHYAGSDVAGSVASMDFEITGIENMLTEVPKEKLISGIPFYSRLWYTETLEDGTTRVTSEAVSMNRALQILEENGVTSVYDESTGQQYAEWTAEDGRFCQIWLEDEASVARRADLVSQYDLGGIAAWVLGNERDFVWETIREHIQ